jgi:hypothetical protein
MTIAVALLVLAALATTLSYTGFLVVGVLAEYIGASRFVAGLLLGFLFARFPWISNGKPRIVGLLPKRARVPLMASLLALCLVRFVTQGDTVSALFAGFTMAFVLAYPWLRNALFARISSSVVNFADGRHAPIAANDTVIDGEFREVKK